MAKLGSTVVYTDENGKTCPAVVTQISTDAVASLILNPGTDNAKTVSSVPHVEKLPPVVHWSELPAASAKGGQ